MTPLLIKAFHTTNAIGPYLIVAGGAGNAIAVASAATDSLIGVTGKLGADVDTMADLTQAGWAEVTAGDDVDLGDPLTADADGKAVKAVPVAGSVVRIIGYAMADGADGDVIPLLVGPGILNTPAA